MNKFICIHGHFYQPPRENPWLEAIEIQESAAPYHDWNERITAECYAPNAACRILEDRRILDVANNYAKISFNFGPTLLSWMEKHKPEVYQSILEADRESQKNFSGHGSALAQAYNHMIMPLANRRDKETQVIWGIRDFEHRFKRKPEGMWLPETAVDVETLDVLAEHGIQFTVLAPHQAKRIKNLNDNHWKDAQGNIDLNVPYRCRLPGGHSIVLFFYDGGASHDVAFGGLLNSGETFANRLIGSFPDDTQVRLMHIATDGETYGHHHRFGDMALAYCLHYIQHHVERGVGLTIYGEFLNKFPPTHEVEIVESTSWSCAHGVERWRANCGCSVATHPGWTQQWRQPLRSCMDWLRDKLIDVYEKEMKVFTQDPWAARNNYIDVVLNRSEESISKFIQKNMSVKEDKIKILKLMEMQRHVMLMYTSCGWFFDDISGIETIQVLQYAARAMQLAQEVGGPDLEKEFLDQLSLALSNKSEMKNGRRVYEEFVTPAVVDIRRVGVHYAIGSLFEMFTSKEKIYYYKVTRKGSETDFSGRKRFIVGQAHIVSEITDEEADVIFAVLHREAEQIQIDARLRLGPVLDFENIQKELNSLFLKNDIAKLKERMAELIDKREYGLSDLFKTEQERILNRILYPTLKELEVIFRQIYQHHKPLMKADIHSHVSLPKALATTMEFVLNRDLQQLLEMDKIDYNRLAGLVEEFRRWSFAVDPSLNFLASQRVNTLMDKFSFSADDILRLEHIIKLLTNLQKLPLALDVWRSQNIYFFVQKKVLATQLEKSKKGEAQNQKWVQLFNELGQLLQIKSG